MVGPNVGHDGIKLLLIYLDIVHGNLRTNQKRKKEQRKEWKGERRGGRKRLLTD